jgi:hypothetical protein
MGTDKNGNYIYVINLDFVAEYRSRRISTDINSSNPYLLGTAYFVNISEYFEIGKLFNRGTGRR